MNTDYSNEVAMPTQLEKLYLPDFNKIDDLNKLKAIIVAIGFVFTPSHPFFESLQPLLTEINDGTREQLADELKENLEALGLEKVEEGRIIQF